MQCGRISNFRRSWSKVANGRSLTASTHSIIAISSRQSHRFRERASAFPQSMDSIAKRRIPFLWNSRNNILIPWLSSFGITRHAIDRRSTEQFRDLLSFFFHHTRQNSILRSASLRNCTRRPQTTSFRRSKRKKPQSRNDRGFLLVILMG